MSLAVVVWRAGPARPINRRLALLLAVEALNVFASFSVADKLTDDPATRYAWAITVFTSDIFLIAGYLSFIGLALPTPLVRFLRPRRAVWILWSAAFAAGVMLVTSPTKLLPSIGALTAFGPWLWAVWASVALAFAFGLVAAVHAWAISPPAVARRLRPYLLAFGVRDLGLIVFFGALVYWGLRGAFSPAAWVVLPLFQDAVMLVYLPLLAYGLLRTQLFDIDLRIKLAISKSTVVALFAGLVFVASEVVEQFLGVDQLVPAIVAAGVIALAMRPLVHVGERVADRVMPGVEDTPEYRENRGTELYRAALESAAVDGEITDKERAMLATLMERLDVPQAQAAAIERDVLAQRGVA